MSHRTRFIPTGTPTPAPKNTDVSVPLNDSQSTAPKEKESTTASIPVPKLNLSSLKKKAAAAKTRQGHAAQRTHHQGHHQHRTLIIPPTVLEIDETEKSDIPGSTTTIEIENVATSPNVPLMRHNSSQPMVTGMPAPAPGLDGQPPAYTTSYAPPPGFMDHQMQNMPLSTHTQVTQTHIHHPPQSPAIFGRRIHHHFQHDIPGSPHTTSAASYSATATTYAQPGSQLRHSQSTPYHAHGHVGHAHIHGLHDDGFVRPATPGPGDREKRASTAESADEREREMDAERFRGRSKRSRLHLGDVDMEVFSFSLSTYYMLFYAFLSIRTNETRPTPT